ncbi:DUF6879 family protein [Streptomyces antimycoticus]|uniref:DUF6879 family protein n=1 Tax=Streptomyces antimycoticus TaxID=68175 RepID=UPI0025707031|nr:DUF6879 family protein [Streptomyces antimycoticus]WJD97237.1 hypothetical protein QR300_15275 [Streptomyces antimycoticus]
MLSLELPVLDISQGDRLSRDAYRADFRERVWGDEGHDSWKLERQQHFQEPGSDSWKAFSQGDWEGALRLIEQRRDGLLQYMGEAAKRNFSLYRVRVVEEPIAPYLQWELHLLRLRAECGERIRVVGPEHIRGFEESGPLPELVSLGGRTLYKVVYDSRGISDGAVRFVDPDVLTRWEEFIEGLYEAGEEMSSYFERKVAPLPPPTAAE